MIFEKSNPVKDSGAYTEWNAAHNYCMCCGIQVNQNPYRVLTTHHIIKSGRSDETCNLLRLCWQPCHMAFEGQSSRIQGLIDPNIRGHKPDFVLYRAMSVGQALWLKKNRDGADWKPERLEVLYHKALPDLVKPFPEYQNDWAFLSPLIDPDLFWWKK